MQPKFKDSDVPLQEPGHEIRLRDANSCQVLDFLQPPVSPPHSQPRVRSLSAISIPTATFRFRLPIEYEPRSSSSLDCRDLLETFFRRAFKRLIILEPRQLTIGQG